MIFRFIIPSTSTMGNTFPDTYALFLDQHNITQYDLMREAFRLANSIPYDVLQLAILNNDLDRYIDPALFNKLTENVKPIPPALYGMFLKGIEIFIMNFSVALINAHASAKSMVIQNCDPMQLPEILNQMVIDLHAISPGPSGYDTIIDVSAT